ncbi:hypothetical protein EJ03DRAFT_347936 [Teratosphaeria nubilosa]|uniref:Uncharacterized protein n=1 Tax=Teratosphaeria nubilosa TaxID=161662 RepID=A0A6G1LLD8_9PEZI|nr:hypothetical protein EJ03DRAFT_347936 [Teratosphaeria nubilosa]
MDTNLVNEYLPQPAYDYPHETGRTAVDLVYSNMLGEHASTCKIILSQWMPVEACEVDGGCACCDEHCAREVLDEARSFYYDTALSSSPMQMKALKELLKGGAENHVMFASDFSECG